MEFLFELLFGLLFEGSVEAAKSEKVPRWIRYPLIALLSLFVVGVLVGIVVLGVFLIVRGKEAFDLPLGIVLLVLGAVMWVSAVRKVRMQLRKRAEEISKKEEKEYK